ncbi:MAG: endonuclease/exonuclease/phosphatase family protein [Kiloniellales bacterium]|nr:endonuclease/exonuclease/phosphatase family protein [Kiloniellales bacterium]
MPFLRGSFRLAAATLALAGVALTATAASADDGFPFRATTLRVATFNASLSPFSLGGLEAQLADPSDPQARAIAEIIQRVDPDVLLINEFNFDENDGGESRALALFLENFLEVPQNGAAPIRFDHVFLAPSNTGVPSGLDLDNDGSIGGGNDAFGFGFFPGHFAMVLLSKHPIREAQVRTFRNFLWKDMPGALLPDDPATPEPEDWHSAEELAVFRLSSKSHWDVPIEVAGRVVHLLASHPTPPVFDGPEDRNGTRNHDEIRFWSDYVLPFRGRYIYDDAGRRGGLRFGRPFVVLGDLNADPFDGDSTGNAARQLLRNPLIARRPVPASDGGVEAAALQGGENDTHRGDPAFDTADFGDAAPSPGNLRVDYVLASRQLRIKRAEVFWPIQGDPLAALVSASDHRLVYVDVKLLPGFGGPFASAAD